MLGWFYVFVGTSTFPFMAVKDIITVSWVFGPLLQKSLGYTECNYAD